MATITVTDEIVNRLEEFGSVICAVVGEETNLDACIVAVLERGLDAMLADVIARADDGVLVQSIQQMAARHPRLVYRYVAEMIALGSEPSDQSAARSIGF